MIYSFLYAFFYQLSEKLRSDDSRFYSGVLLAIPITLHLLLIASIVKAVFPFEGFEAPLGKYTYFPFVVLLIWSVEYLVKKNSNSMLIRYKAKDLLTIRHTFVVLILMFAPLVVSIILLRK